MIKKSAFLSLCVMLFLFTTGPAAAGAKEPYKIGGIFAVSGPASFLGEPERNTFELVAELINEAGGINGHPLELVVYDTEANPTKTVVAVK